MATAATSHLFHVSCNQARTCCPLPPARQAAAMLPTNYAHPARLWCCLTGIEVAVPAMPRASQADGNIVPSDADDGVSLGTMKLPPDTDIPRFETLLFQWANSLCQGANLPLPVPLKVDKVEGGARLGFIKVEDGKTEVFVYIDCLVFPATGSSGPVFRAIRNGPLKNQTPPGEQRIIRSLLQALQKSVQIARV